MSQTVGSMTSAMPLTRQELGWAPTTMFKDGIKLAIKWYQEHMDWMNKCTSGEYENYYEEVYGKR